MKNRSLYIIGIVAIILIAVAVFSLNASRNNDNEISAYKVILDGKTWFYIQDKTKLEGLLEEYKNQYTAEIDKNVRIKSIGFKQKLDIDEVTIDREDLSSLQEAKEKIHTKAKEASQIEVKAGDNLWSIAHAKQVSVDDLQNLNPQLDEQMRIYPGDKLTIKAEVPVLSVVIVYEVTVIEDIPFTTEYIKDSSLYESQRKVVSQGIVGKEEKVYEIVFENDMELGRKTLHSKVITPPVASQVRIGTKQTVSRSGSSFGVVSGRLTSRFGTRIHPVTGKKVFHKGIDIGASHGSPVYAYSSGTVIYAGWNNGYGNFVAINHGNGMVTRYGHLSKIHVKFGQKVATRQRIGSVGSSGVSTGPHLHFEVLINGVNKNPLNYL